MITKYATTVATDTKGVTHLTHHSTIIMQWDNDTLTLDSGGWKSSSTKKRMNQASRTYCLGVHVYQKAHDWFVDYNGKTILYKDGMQLTRH